MSILSKIFGDPNKKLLDRYWPLVEKINALEKEYEGLPTKDLKGKTQEFRQRLNGGEPLDDLLSEAFAACREAAKRTIGQRHFDAQLIGGLVLHQGRIAEMKTGEGKTLAATLPAYLNALEGQGVHIVTVNDYLSRRDANWMGAVYHVLGLSVGCIAHEKSYVYQPKVLDKNEVTVEMENLVLVSRSAAYGADITYGTNNEFGFDYLRDNMVQESAQMAQRGHRFAIVDEVDSILIDEARTPLIISAPDAESTKLYETFSKIVPRLKEGEDYNIDEKMRAVTLTEQGIEKIEKILGMDIYNEGGIGYVHHLEQALRAQVLFHRDKQYVVKEGEVVIVDDFTGRLMFGRRYSEGLHQAIEAKEGVKVQQESRTLATITFQNYFRMYKKLAGMTGTAATSAEEFLKVYNLDVVVVPTNKPMIRADMPDKIFRTERGKFSAVAAEVKKRHKIGQPVLVGTVSIEKNEFLSALLKKEGVPHQILNAKNHEQEALIIAQAGRFRTVTVATNMAGRGVDIILGGKRAENSLQPFPKGANLSPGGVKGDFADWQKDHGEVVAVGGLYIIGTERHEARRIDNQLRGRGGRQGDPGSSQFFVSLEDDLMRIFGSNRMKRMMEVLKVPEDQPIENRMLSRAIESAQAKIEGFHFDARKHVLEYDDVMNKQRQRIYSWRRQVLEANTDVNKELDARENAKAENSLQPALKEENSFLGAAKGDFVANSDLRGKILQFVEKEISGIVATSALGDPREWHLKEIFEAANAIFPLSEGAREKIKEFKSPEEVEYYLMEAAEEAYEFKKKEVGEPAMREIEKSLMLRAIDMFWVDHLDNMDHLRNSVRLRAYGQKDPLVEYKNEGRRLFQSLLAAIESNVARMIYRVTIAKSSADYHSLTGSGRTAGGQTGNLRAGGQLPANKKNIGRNEPCWCGSGKKYKRCHGA